MTYEMALLDREIQGREEGRVEERITLIKNFLAAGAPIELITKATGWSEDKIRQIQNSHAPNQLL